MADSIYSSAASSDVSSNVSDFTNSESVDLTGDELEERIIDTGVKSYRFEPFLAGVSSESDDGSASYDEEGTDFGSSSSLAEEDDENKKKWRERMNTLDWLVPWLVFLPILGALERRYHSENNLICSLCTGYLGIYITTRV